jgi:ParB family chromosome partitioning protein
MTQDPNSGTRSSDAIGKSVQGKLGRGLGRLIPIGGAQSAGKSSQEARSTRRDSDSETSPGSTDSAALGSNSNSVHPSKSDSATGSTATSSTRSETSDPSNSVTSSPSELGIAAMSASVASPPSTSPSITPQSLRAVLGIELGRITPNSRQPRRDFDLASIEELAESIRSAGLLQPVVVRPILGKSGHFELIAGERRWRACRHLGWKEIPAIVTHATDQDAGVWALIENVHRADLNPIERALAMKQLASEFRLTHESLAERVGLDRSTVTNLLRLAELDETTASMVRNGLLSQGHAKALLGVDNLKTRSTLAESAVRGDWSVRALEREVQRLINDSSNMVPRGTESASGRRRSNIEALEKKLSQAMATDVKIQPGRKPNSGKIQISFYSLEQFESVLRTVGVNPDSVSLD